MNENFVQQGDTGWRRRHNMVKLLQVNNLKKHFHLGKDEILKAVDGVSFHINKGETFGIVGESGCGKSTAGRTIIGLYDQTEGEVIFKGKNIHTLKSKERHCFSPANADDLSRSLCIIKSKINSS